MRKNVVVVVAVLVAGLIGAGLIGATSARVAAPLQIAVSFAAAAHPEAVTGRLLVYVSHRATPEPRLQASRFGSSPFFGIDVDQLAPGAPATIDERTLGYPVDSLRQLPAGDYYMQALFSVYTRFTRSDGHTIWAHMDEGEGQQLSRSPGNIYSEPKLVHIDPAVGGTVELVADKVLPAVVQPQDTAWVKHVSMVSPSLSRFWGRPISLSATVLLPFGYNDHPEMRYPVLYEQGHFAAGAPMGFTPDPPAAGRGRGGRGATSATPPPVGPVDPRETGYEFYQAWTSADFPRMLVVTFQHTTPFFDDSYAVNSANTGPYGDAITQELIPYIEKQFRAIGQPYARVLSGGSTGGWESLDLQVKYPDVFGGTWTFYPDPLDFHHFREINLYDDDNAFDAPGGTEWQHPQRYVMRQPDGQDMLTEREQSRFEAVLGSHSRSGQQMDAFDAAFAPVGADGYPVPMWDRLTGKINHDSVAYARDHGFDITAYARQHWSTLGPQLVGKINVYVGDMDSYFLNLGVYDFESFLHGTESPHYEGSFFYGRPEKPHGWNGGMTNSQLLRLMGQTIGRNAPASRLSPRP